jgi:hypothetical protein
MGKYLDQCLKDAWDITRGRKKIVGNRIISCDSTETTRDNNDYGWLAPNGEFYPVEFGGHQAYASNYLLNEYKKGNIELKCDEDPGDKLCEMGFILLHNPHRYDFSVTRDYNKRITNRQKEFLIDYFEKRNMNQWLEKLYQEEI